MQKKRAIFSNRVALWVVVALLYGLLLWNAVLVSALGHPIGIIHVILLPILLYLIFIRHHLARRALQLWSFFALVFIALLQGVSKILIHQGSDSTNLKPIDLVSDLVMIGLGLLLLVVVSIYMKEEVVEDQ